ELFTDPSFPNISYHSTIDPDPFYQEGALSEQDYTAVFNDTLHKLSYDYLTYSFHKPLKIEIIQKTHSWSYPYTEDFVIFDVNVRNIGDNILKDFYLGLSVQPSVSLYIKAPRALDEIAGFLKDHDSYEGCGYKDTLNMVWFADNDGDPFNGEFINQTVWIEDGFIVEGNNVTPNSEPFKSVPHVVGIRFIDNKIKLEDISFNWWINWYYEKFGPRRINENLPHAIKSLVNTAYGDKTKYHLLSNKEIDYDVSDIGLIRHMNSIWQTPTDQEISLFGKGALGNQSWRKGDFVFSRGPYNIPPNTSMDFVFAVIAGENLHRAPYNINNLPDDPLAFKANLDFSDLARNSMWAAWIYDNPGVDTDGDGYFGKYRICNFDSIQTDSGWTITLAETTFYEGDGIPDWRAAGPPPPPAFWVEPLLNGIRVRFNGTESETEKDFMTGKVDFEGYNVWIGRDDRESSLSIIATYDRENYDKYVWNPKLSPNPDFEILDRPYTIEELRCLYGNDCNDSIFNPDIFTKTNPFYHPEYSDSIFYFMPHNFNASEFGITSPIKKVYPDAPKPPSNIHPDSLNEDWYTPEGYMKYYEYEIIIDNLLATVPYWINVTTFDQGSPKSGLFPLETPKRFGLKDIYPYISSSQSTGEKLKAYVYPNPYRIDGKYRQHGYEHRTISDLPNDKVRQINFANLPHKCTIRIFTLDGDLVRELWHDFDEDDPNRFHASWDLINRNRQIVVSGLYYWTVEDEQGEIQMGKLVIIM
ncbi:MAG: hypothetical protein DRP35_05260, partial [Candidatus Zixiibacteriota bacterium]